MSYKQMTGNIISATKVEPDGFYQDSAASSWTDPDPDDPDATVAFNAAAHAQRVWDDLDTFNG